MPYNIADLFEHTVGRRPRPSGPDRRDTRLTYRRARCPGQPVRPLPRRAGRAAGRPRRHLRQNSDAVDRGHARLPQGPGGPDQHQLPLRRGRAVLPDRQRRAGGLRVRPEYAARLAARRRRVTRSCTRSSTSRTAPVPTSAALGSVAFEDAVAAGSPERDFGDRSRRRHLHHLHRRHHGHAQGRHVAPRGHLLRPGPGHRRPDRRAGRRRVHHGREGGGVARPAWSSASSHRSCTVPRRSPRSASGSSGTTIVLLPKFAAEAVWELVDDRAASTR